MRPSAAIALLLCTSVSFAQNCLQNDLGFDSVNTVYWADGAIRVGGGYAITAVDDMAGHALTLRTDQEGNVIWKERVDATDPEVWLQAKKVVVTMDGGMAVFGYRWDTNGNMQYMNMFVLKYDAQGNREWSRIYMMSSEPSYDWSRTTSMAALPDGDLLLAVARGNGICAVKLDAQGGLPVWVKRYDPCTVQETWNTTGYEVLADPDGSIAYLGRAQDELFMLRTDANGDPLWAYRYPALVPYGQSLTRCANGDFVMVGWQIGGASAMIRVDENGSVLWSRSYPASYNGSMSYLSDVGELSNGDLLFTAEYGVGISVLRTNAAGDAMEQWSATENERIIDLIGTANDSIRFTMSMNVDEPGQYPELTIAPTLADLSCALSSSSPLTTQPFSITGITDTLTVAVDSIKTWTLSAGTPLSDGELDLSTYFSAGSARPGFQMAYYALIYNLGGQPSGPITATMTFDPLLSYLNAVPAPSTVNGNTITWDLPATSGYSLTGPNGIQIHFLVPVSATLGYQLDATMTVTQDSTEAVLANNTATVSRIITGSYDPNDKLVVPQQFYHIENDSILDYTIRFQNTGTDTAFNVVVIDTLPLDVDATMFERGASSHPYTYSLTGNGILTFTFENILLPDSNTNEPLSHGLVNFRIKPILPLALGQEITNAADIYFDFNPPIHTPDATVIVTDETGVRPVAVPEKLVVFPVPVKNTLTAVLPGGFKPASAWAVGGDGRRIPLLRSGLTGDQTPFDVQHLPRGAYVLTLVDRNGRRMSARFTKE